MDTRERVASLWEQLTQDERCISVLVQEIKRLQEQKMAAELCQNLFYTANEGEMVTGSYLQTDTTDIEVVLPPRAETPMEHGGMVMEGGERLASNTNSPQSLHYQAPDVEHLRREGWKRTALMVWKEIAGHCGAALFMDLPEEPDYVNLIHYPVSLQSIKEGIRDERITKAVDLHRELVMLYANAMMYNVEGSAIYNQAVELANHTESIISPLYQAELESNCAL